MPEGNDPESKESVTIRPTITERVESKKLGLLPDLIKIENTISSNAISSEDFLNRDYGIDDGIIVELVNTENYHARSADLQIKLKLLKSEYLRIYIKELRLINFSEIGLGGFDTTQELFKGLKKLTIWIPSKHAGNRGHSSNFPLYRTSANLALKYRDSWETDITTIIYNKEEIRTYDKVPEKDIIGTCSVYNNKTAKRRHNSSHDSTQDAEPPTKKAKITAPTKALEPKLLPEPDNNGREILGVHTQNHLKSPSFVTPKINTSDKNVSFVQMLGSENRPPQPPAISTINNTSTESQPTTASTSTTSKPNTSNFQARMQNEPVRGRE